MTVFTCLFAAACLTTLALGARKGWRNARIVSAVVAIVSFMMALFSASVTKQ